MVVLRLNDVDLDIGENIKFVRDTVNGNSINTNNEWAEITLNDMSDTSIRTTQAGVGMKAYSSGPIPDASSVINGTIVDTTTLSVTPGTQASVTVELSDITKIKSINIIRKYSDSRIYNNVKTEISTDGYNWVTIYDSNIDGTYTETSSGNTIHLKQTTVVAADWEVSTVRNFSNLLISSYNNTTYKDHMVFQDILDPTITYYGRVRLLLDKIGYTVWFDVTVFIPQDVINHTKLLNPPGLVTPPRITTNYPQINHPGTLFTISASGFASEANDTLSSTSWVIYDIDGNIIWYSFYDTINLNKFVIDPSILVLNDKSVYKISVAFHTTGSDSSSFATKTIHVNNNDQANVIREHIDAVDSTIINNFRILNMSGLTNTIITITEQGTNNTVVYTTTLTAGAVNFQIPAATLVGAKDYLVTVEPFDINGTLNKRFTYMKTI